MSGILEVFGRARVLLPVVHTLDVAQVIESVSVAVDNGADGVFVINQDMHEGEIVRMLPDLARRCPWLGVNLLGQSLARVLDLAGASVRGIWTDSSSPEDCDTMRRVRDGSAPAWSGLWFGGTAFKYTSDENGDPRSLIDRQRGAVDVVTTSGQGTGIAAVRSKVSAFRSALGGRPLALASGITPENVEDYADVDAFLVATGIETRFGVLDPKRVRALADTIHGAQA